MKILIYAHTFAPALGGVETIVRVLAEGLQRLRDVESNPPIDVTVVTQTPRGLMDDATLPFPVVRRPRLLGLIRLVAKADVVHMAGPSFLPLCLALALGRTVVVEHHGFQVVCPNGQMFHEPSQSLCPGHFMAGRHGECIRCNRKGGVVRSGKMWAFTFPRRWLSKRVAANIAPTAWLARVLALPKTVTIHHGLASVPAASVFSPSSEPCFACVGRLVSTKGVRVLLEASGRLRSKGYRFRLKIIGDGPERNDLMAWARNHGLGQVVEFLGQLPDTQLDETLAGVWALIIPSLAGEVFNLVAAQSMLPGRMLIVSDLGPLAEVVGEAGLRFAPGDSVALADCMESILLNPGLARERGNSARVRAQRLFGEESMIAEHRAIYSRLGKGPDV